MKNKYIVYIICITFLLVIYSGKSQTGNFTLEIISPDDTVFVCQNEIIFFKANGINTDSSGFEYDEVTFQWEIAHDNVTKFGRNVDYRYPEGGIFVVKLNAWGPDNNYSLNQPIVIVKVAPTPVFIDTYSNLPSICSGSELILSGSVKPVQIISDSLSHTNTFDEDEFEWFGNGVYLNDFGVARATPELNKGHQEYIFQAKDNFGCYYDTIIPVYGLVANYSFDPFEGEAPLDVNFTPDSLDNGGDEGSIIFDWEFMEIHDTTNVDSSSLNNYTFERPGDYATKLIASYNQCTYTYINNQHIHVDSSLLEVPNVFTPNGDGMNDYFQVRSVSIMSFEGVIFNRWGKVVYEWTEWKNLESGWNGKVMGEGKDAPEGVYFYIIKAVGWDDVKYRDGLYKGSVHLFR